MPDNVLTVAEVAEYLRVCPSTIYRLLKDRKMPAFRIGTEWRFNLEHVDQWRIARQKSERRQRPH
jgi:excisionase family DNA binding protein